MFSSSWSLHSQRHSQFLNLISHGLSSPKLQVLTEQYAKPETFSFFLLDLLSLSSLYWLRTTLKLDFNFFQKPNKYYSLQKFWLESKKTFIC